MQFDEQPRQDENPLVTARELTDELGDECDAYRAGAYLRYARSHDLPLSGWMWLNTIAHGSHDTVVSAASGGSCPGWDGTTAVLAQALLAAAGSDTSSVQRLVLIRLELELIGRTVTPRRLIELATSRLFDAEVPA